jgi:hypothetical protein
MLYFRFYLRDMSGDIVRKTANVRGVSTQGSRKRVWLQSVDTSTTIHDDSSTAA